MSLVKGQATPEPMLVELMGLLLGAVKAAFPDEDWHGLRQSHFRMLHAVGSGGDGGVTVTGLAERLGMTKQGCGQFVTFLTDAGYLRAEQSNTDRRLRLVHRTSAGDAVIDTFRKRLDDLERDWAQQVGPRRYATFRAVMAELGGAHSR